MKKRMGFVSNSSSSSFLIFSKGELTRERLEEVFKVPENYPLKGLAKEIAGTLFVGSEKFDNWDDYVLREYNGDLREALEYSPKGLREKFNEGWFVYTGSLTNEDEPFEAFLCDEDIYVTTPDLIIDHEGGY